MTSKEKVDEMISRYSLEYAIAVADQICSLTGLPQFQIIFWRDVRKQLEAMQ